MKAEIALEKYKPLEIINKYLLDGMKVVGDLFGSGQIDITYSDIDGGWDGEGNIDDDPLFTDASSGDYTITEESPCKDTGIADTDGDGEDDITDYNGTAPDMGAFEISMPAVTGFTFYTFDTYISLTWNPTNEEGFQYYLLERSTDEEFSEENTVGNYLMSNYYEDTSLEYDIEFFYDNNIERAIDILDDEYLIAKNNLDYSGMAGINN